MAQEVMERGSLSSSVLERLEKNDNTLKDLIVQDISSLDVVRLSNALKNNDQLTTLRVRDNAESGKISVGALLVLLQTVVQKANIKHLYLGRCRNIDSECMRVLASTTKLE